MPPAKALQENGEGHAVVSRSSAPVVRYKVKGLREMEKVLKVEIPGSQGVPRMGVIFEGLKFEPLVLLDTSRIKYYP